MAETDYMQAFQKISLGIVPHLEKLPGVSNVIVEEKSPAERHQLLMWEQQNSCFLPDDMKSFYMTTNGVKLSWCIKFDDEILPIGLMEINSIDKISQVSGNKQTGTDQPVLADLENNVIKRQNSPDSVDGYPHFDESCRIFELDPCRQAGKVCLVYRNAETGTPSQNAEVWFLDRSFRWHFLTSTFSEYFQMMLGHIGLPEWQYIFTDIGLSPQAQTWFHMFSPMRLAIDEGTKSKMFLHQDDASVEVKIDNNRVFKAKSEKRTKSGSQKKKVNQNNKPSSSRTGLPPSSSRPK